LTNVIQLQQVQIGGLEKQLTTVVSMLQNISSQQQSQQNQLQNLNQQLNTQKPNVSKSSTATAVVGGSTEGRLSGGAVGQDRSRDRRVHSDRSVWGQRTDSATEEVAAVDYDSQFTLIVHRTLDDVSRRRRNIIVTGLPEESDTNVSDRTTFEEFAAAFLPSKPALATGRNCIRLGKASFFPPASPARPSGVGRRRRCVAQGRAEPPTCQ